MLRALVLSLSCGVHLVGSFTLLRDDDISLSIDGAEAEPLSGSINKASALVTMPGTPAHMATVTLSRHGHLIA